MSYIKQLLPALATFFLVACGGGGGGGAIGPTYDGLTTPAAITGTNGQEVATKSAEATDSAIDQTNANEANPFFFGVEITPASPELSSFVTDVARQVVEKIQPLGNIPTGVTYTASQLGYPFCGGSISFPDAWASSSTTTLNGTMTFSNLCISDSYFGQFTINGSVTFSETATEITIRYTNFSISDGTSTETINMTITCNATWSSCSLSADYVGEDGSTYRIADLVITGFNTGPYTITARFYHPDHGYVDLSGSGIYYNCPDGSVSAGTINITGSGGSSASITVTGCGTYTGDWDNGSGGTGMFSGTF